MYISHTQQQVYLPYTRLRFSKHVYEQSTWMHSTLHIFLTKNNSTYSLHFHKQGNSIWNAQIHVHVDKYTCVYKYTYMYMCCVCM